MTDEPSLFLELQTIDCNWRLSFARAGLICKKVSDGQLWRERIDPETGEPCVSLSRWIHCAAPLSASTCYSAMRAISELSDIPEAEVAKINTSNFPIVLQLSSAVRADPKVLKAAQTQSTVDLIEHIQKNHPNQAIEHKVTLRFRVDQSANEPIQLALRYAQFLGAVTLEEALEAVCREAMESWKYADGLSELEATL